MGLVGIAIVRRLEYRWKEWFRTERGEVQAPAGVCFDELGIVLALALFLFIGAVSSPYFLTVTNLAGILQNITFLGFLCIGVGLTLMAGEIDISVGSIFGLSAVITALLLKAGYPLAVAILAGLAAGLVCGFVNGAVAQAIKVPAVVVTLATLGIYRAIALALANGSPVGGVPTRRCSRLVRPGRIAQIPTSPSCSWPSLPSVKLRCADVVRLPPGHRQQLVQHLVASRSNARGFWF